MTEARMREAQERLDATTPGPWTTRRGLSGVFVKHKGPGPAEAPGRLDWLEIVGDNAAFIANAPADLGDALAALRRVREVRRVTVYVSRTEWDGSAEVEAGDMPPGHGEFVRWDDLVAAIEGMTTGV